MAEILGFKPNPFNGAVIDRSALPVDPDEFDASLPSRSSNGLPMVS